MMKRWMFALVLVLATAPAFAQKHDADGRQETVTQITDFTDDALVSTAGSLAVDFAEIEGAALAATNPIPSRLTDGTSFIIGVLDTTVTTRFPAGSTPADNESNAVTITRTGMFSYVFDGSTWDRMRGDSTDGVLVNLGTNNDVTITGTVTTTPSLVGGGTEAAAQRVTIASDSTGLLSVDDNSGSLTVDAPLGTPVHVRQSDGTDVVNVTAANEMNVIATAQPGVDIGDVDVLSSALPTGASTSALQLADGHNVTVDNASGASAVNIQDGGNAITVDGTVTSNAGTGDRLLVTGHTTNEALKESSAVGGQLDDTATTAATENNVASVRITAQRSLHATIRDSVGDSAMDDANNALNVNVVAGGAGDGKILDGTAGGEADVENAVIASATLEGLITRPYPMGDGTLTATLRDTGSNDSQNVAIVDASGNQITSFGGSGGTSETDEATYTPTTTAGTPVMYAADETAPDSAAEGVVGIARMTLTRKPYAVIANATGETSATVGANGLEVDVQASALPAGAATSANQLPSGHDVTVDNASGASAVNVQDGGNILTVDGTVTADAGTGTFTVDGSGVTQPISAASLPLPAGASTSANQLAAGHDVTVDNASGGAAVNIQDGGNIITVDGTVTADAGTGDFLTPVGHTINEVFKESASVGGQLDDTATTAATENNVAPVRITAQRSLHMTIRDSAGDSAMDDANDALNVNVVAGGAGDGKILDGTGAGEADVENAVLASTTLEGLVTRPYMPGDGSLTVTARNTGSNDSMNVAIVDASGNQITSFGGGVQFLEDTPSADAEELTMAGARREDTPASSTSLDGDRSNIKVDSVGRLWVNPSDVTSPISAASLPLPAGAATSANQLAAGHDVTVDNAAGASAVNIQDGGNVLSVDDNGVNLSVDWGGTVPPIGSGTEAAALRVAIATDSTIALEASSNNVGDVDVASITPVTATGTLTAVSQSVTIDVGGYGSVAIQVTGTWVALLGFDATVDGTNWVDLQVNTSDGLSTQLIANTNGLRSANVGGYDQIRVFTDTFTSGTVQVDMQASVASAKTPSDFAREVTLGNVVVQLQVQADWDESNRAAINPIPGEVGVDGGTGVDTGRVQRVTLATDIPLPAGTNNIGDVDILSLPNEGTQTAANSISVTIASDIAIGETDQPVSTAQGLVVRQPISCSEQDPISQTADTQIITGVASQFIYICSITLIASAAETVSITSGTGTVCGTSETALYGSTTEANGMAFPANGGFANVSGQPFMRTQVTGDNLCITQVGSARISGSISYVVEP